MTLKKLDDVIREVNRSPKFLDDLLVNSRRALTKKGWQLSVRDMTKLRKLLKEQKDVKKFLTKIFRRVVRSTNPWPVPPSWSPLKCWRPPTWIPGKGSAWRKSR